MRRHLHFLNGQPRRSELAQRQGPFWMLIIARQSASRGKTEKMPLPSRTILVKDVVATFVSFPFQCTIVVKFSKMLPSRSWGAASRDLKDIATFDDASRGPCSAITMLLKILIQCDIM